MVPDRVQNSLPDSRVWHCACNNNSANHGRKDGKEVRRPLPCIFPRHVRQELLAKFQDRRRAPLLQGRPRPGDVGSQGGNGTSVIRMVTTLQRKVAPHHGFPAFAWFHLFRRRYEPVTKLLQAFLDRFDDQVVATPKVPIETPMCQARSLHQCGHRRPVQTFGAQLTGGIVDDSSVDPGFVVGVVTHTSIRLHMSSHQSQAAPAPPGTKAASANPAGFYGPSHLFGVRGPVKETRLAEFTYKAAAKQLFDQLQDISGTRS